MNSPSGEGLKTTQSSVFSVRLIEARLSVSVAKFGAMSLYSEIQYGAQFIRSQIATGSDSAPKWEEMHLLEVTDAQTVTVKVLHKALIVGDVVVGQCDIELNRLLRRRNTDWWTLEGSKGVSGSIKVSFCFDDDLHPRSPSPPLHSPNFKDDLSRKINELELEKEELEYYKLKYKRKAEELNQEKRRYRLRLQTISIRNKAEDGFLSPTSHFNPTDDLNRRQKSLNLRENSLQMERKRIQEERLKVENDREKVRRLREEVAMEYAKLRREKQRKEKREVTGSEENSPCVTQVSGGNRDWEERLCPLSERGPGRLLVFS